MTLTEQQRGWIYRGIFVIALIGIVVGLVTEEEVIAAINSAAALASSGLATLNTTVRKVIDPPNDDGQGVWGVIALIAVIVLIVMSLLLVLNVINIKG